MVNISYKADVKKCKKKFKYRKVEFGYWWTVEKELEDAVADLSRLRDKLSNSKMREVTLDAISKRVSTCDDDLCAAARYNGADIVCNIEDKTVRDFVQSELRILNRDLNAPIATYKTVSNRRNASVVVVYFKAERRAARRKARKLRKYLKQISDYMEIASFLYSEEDIDEPDNKVLGTVTHK